MFCAGCWSYTSGWDTDSILKDYDFLEEQTVWLLGTASAIGYQDTADWSISAEESPVESETKGTSKYILKAGAVPWLGVVRLGKDKDIKS